MSQRLRFQSAALVAAFWVAASIGAIADSHVRIVRLSSIEGDVQIDRGSGEGLQRAILNTPIVEGTRLVTGENGLAEVEFENESALRLTGGSEVKFSDLLLSDSGTKINQFRVDKGLVYLETAKGNDVYRVKVGDTSLLVHRDSLIRLSATPAQVQVAVFKGDVQLENQAEPVSVHKKETLTVDAQDPSKYAIAKGTEIERFDAWNKERDDYRETYAANEGYGGPNLGYGLQDLNYYGNFFYAGGYGYVWQPYGFAGSLVNWNPYCNGAWMFYPGLGYTWASAYPWGWLPYHYGSWAYINNTGWAWVPGRYNGRWYANNFVTAPRITRAPAGWAVPTAPALLGGASAPRTVTVGTVSPGGTVIPGGRIPPNFASVVPGRAAGFADPVRGSAALGRGGIFAVPTNSMASPRGGMQGHVFAPPMRGIGVAGPEIGGFHEGGRSTGGMSMGHGGMGTSMGHGGMGGSGGHSSGGGGHK